MEPIILTNLVALSLGCDLKNVRTSPSEQSWEQAPLCPVGEPAEGLDHFCLVAASVVFLTVR